MLEGKKYCVLHHYLQKVFEYLKQELILEKNDLDGLQ